MIGFALFVAIVLGRAALGDDLATAYYQTALLLRVWYYFFLAFEGFASLILVLVGVNRRLSHPDEEKTFQRFIGWYVVGVIVFTVCLVLQFVPLIAGTNIMMAGHFLYGLVAIVIGIAFQALSLAWTRMWLAITF